MTFTTKEMMQKIAAMPDGPPKQSMLRQMRTPQLTERSVQTDQPTDRSVKKVATSRQVAASIRATEPPCWMSIWVPGWHPARLNQIMAGHWSNGGRIKKADSEILLAAFRASRVPEATGPRHVNVHLVLGKGRRGCDPDSRNKSLLDGLVKAGALVDDTRRLCLLGPTSFSRAERDVWGTLILLRDEL